MSPGWRNLSGLSCGAEKLEEKETKSQAAFGLLIHSVVLSFIMTFYYIAAAPPLR